MLWLVITFYFLLNVELAERHSNPTCSSVLSASLQIYILSEKFSLLNIPKLKLNIINAALLFSIVTVSLMACVCFMNNLICALGRSYHDSLLFCVRVTYFNISRECLCILVVGIPNDKQLCQKSFSKKKLSTYYFHS